jgi:prepilin-type N-terminal cleavage/methylation domain-containing protein
MNRRQGFTLMELLLVVAVLAIVAAAAAPTFFTGANEALSEARKSQLMSAYSNASTAANMNAALYASGAKKDESDAMITAPTVAQLMDGSPIESRTFRNNKDKAGVVYAHYDATSKKISFYYTALAATPTEGSDNTGTLITDISTVWDVIKDN